MRTRRRNPTPTLSKWDFLNKPFVLWLLSSVVLTVVPFAYAKCQADRQYEHAKVLKTENAEMTIVMRTTVFIQRLDEFHSGATNFPNLDERKEELHSILAEFINGSAATNLYPEYNNASIIGLHIQTADPENPPHDFSSPNFTGLVGNLGSIASTDSPEAIDQIANSMLKWAMAYLSMTSENSKVRRE